MTPADITENYGLIVAGNSEMEIIVSWNGEATFQLWQHVGEGEYEGVDVFTSYEIENGEEAREKALEHLAQLEDEEDY